MRVTVERILTGFCQWTYFWCFRFIFIISFEFHFSLQSKNAIVSDRVAFSWRCTSGNCCDVTEHSLFIFTMQRRWSNYSGDFRQMAGKGMKVNSKKLSLVIFDGFSLNMFVRRYACLKDTLKSLKIDLSDLLSAPAYANSHISIKVSSNSLTSSVKSFCKMLHTVIRDNLKKIYKKLMLCTCGISLK